MNFKRNRPNTRLEIEQSIFFNTQPITQITGSKIKEKTLCQNERQKQKRHQIRYLSIVQAARI